MTIKDNGYSFNDDQQSFVVHATGHIKDQAKEDAKYLDELLYAMMDRGWDSSAARDWITSVVRLSR